MSSFIFNDYNSDEDLILTSPVLRPSWFCELNEIETGSITKIVQFSRNFSNAVLEIPEVIKNTSPERMRVIYSRLRGYGKLVLSGSPDEYLNAFATITDPIAVAQRLAEVNISFTLRPFAYALNPTTADFTSVQTPVTNNGTVFSAPEIRFTPTSANMVTLNVNGSVFHVEIPENLVNTEIIVDCEAEVTYSEIGKNKISINNITYGAYPLLTTGETFVCYTGDVSEAKINVRERFF